MMEGINSSMIYLIYYKNYYKWHKVLPVHNTIIYILCSYIYELFHLHNPGLFL
jgi:hypothetical protein